MRTVILLAVAALLSFNSANTQRGNGRQRMTVEERVNNLKKELCLTDSQTTKITVLYTDFQKKRQNGEVISREQMRNEREELNKQIETVLNNEQKEKYKNMQAQHKQYGQGQRGKKLK